MLLDRLEQTPLGDVQPLYVAIAEGEAEQIMWETLCDTKDEFVALDPRWPIGRISDPVAGRSHPPAVLREPVRVMVLISAFKVRGQQREWETLRAAAERARADGLDVRLKFLVAETALRSAIDRAVADDRLDWIEVAHIEKTAFAGRAGHHRLEAQCPALLLPRDLGRHGTGPGARNGCRLFDAGHGIGFGQDSHASSWPALLSCCRTHGC